VPSSRIALLPDTKTQSLSVPTRVGVATKLYISHPVGIPSIPVAPSLLLPQAQSEPSSRIAMAIREDGTLWGWGSRQTGELGDGSPVNSSRQATPIQIGTDNDWASVSVGNSFTMAIRENGTLWAWGTRANGRLGHGDIWGSQTTPMQVGTYDDWVSVSVGNIHTMAIRENGSLWGWGHRANGRLGHGAVAGDQTTPMQIGTDYDWAFVRAVGGHTVAIRKDGSLWAWGDRTHGRLGDGAITGNQTTPARIGTDNDWVYLSTAAHTMAIREDGSLWAWGSQYSGRLGNSISAGVRPTPVRIGTDNDWVSVYAGLNHTMAIREDGTLWVWGIYTVLQGLTGWTTCVASPQILLVRE